MRAHGRSVLVATIVVAACWAWAAGADAHVYWANNDATMERANLDGTGANQRFVTGASGLRTPSNPQRGKA